MTAWTFGQSLRRYYIAILLTAVALVTAFYPALRWMYMRFTETDSYYSHGFIIPLVTAFLVWSRYSELRKVPLTSSRWGLAMVFAGLLSHVAGGIIFQVGFISGISLIIVLGGLSLYLFGTAVTRAIAFPLAFLLFMVPPPKVLLIGVTFKMKMLAAAFAMKLIGMLHVTAERAGSMIYLPNGILTVGDECSGISSLISILTLSVLAAYGTRASLAKRLLLVACAVPVAIAANALRITFLVLAAYVYGVEAAMKGILHYGAGIVLWLCVLVMLAALWRALRCTSEEKRAGT